MLVYENYVIEKSDNLNFKVYKLGVSSTGTDVHKDITYHGSLPQALTRLRRYLHADKYHNSFISVEAAVKRIEEIDKEFTDFLNKLTVSKIQKAFEKEEAQVA